MDYKPTPTAAFGKYPVTLHQSPMQDHFTQNCEKHCHICQLINYHLFISRLFENLEEAANPEGTNLYDVYVESCLPSGVKPKCAKTFGRYVKHCFPQSSSATTRDSGEWTRRKQTYYNVVRVLDDNKPSGLSTRDILEKGLSTYHAEVIECQNGFQVTLSGDVRCDGKPLEYILNISTEGDVSLQVLDKMVDLRQYDIRTKLSAMTIFQVQAMAKSIRSLKLCFGEEDKRVDASNRYLPLTWTIRQGNTERRLHAGNCTVFLPVNSHAKKCVKCRKSIQLKMLSGRGEQDTPLPRGYETPVVPKTTVNDKPSQSSDISNPLEEPIANSSGNPPVETDISSNIAMSPQAVPKTKHRYFTPPASKKKRLSSDTPSPIPVNQFFNKNKSTRDIAVGTTPIKSSSQLLLKFFPYLENRPQLVHMISEQVKGAEHKDARGRRYNKEVISLALTLWTRCPKSYSELLKAGFIFPSPNTLVLYKNCIVQKPGINSEMMTWMHNEAKRNQIPKVGFIGGLILDEMNIQKDLQVSNRGGDWKMIGFPDMGEGCNAMAAMSSNKQNLQLADHVLQFLFHGLTGFRMPFACYPTNQANSSDLYITVWDAVSALQNWEFQVAYISLDGSSNNRAFVKMHFDGNPMAEKLLLTNRTMPSQKIAVIPDPSHVFKKIRNSIFNSGPTPNYTRHLLLNDHHISWKLWEDAYFWCQNRNVNPVAPHPKLTREYIFLTEPGKMRNAFAFETLNENMLYLMQAYQKSLEPKMAESLNCAIELLHKTSCIIRNMTDKRPIQDGSDVRLKENTEVLDWLMAWERSAASPKELMAAECREDWKWMIVGFDSFVKMVLQNHQTSVYPCDINSDIIENFFCSQRGITGGNTTNPGMKNYLYNINSIVLGQSSVSTKSNAGYAGKSAEPYKYSTPGPLQPTKSRRRSLFGDESGKCWFVINWSISVCVQTISLFTPSFFKLLCPDVNRDIWNQHLPVDGSI